MCRHRLKTETYKRRRTKSRITFFNKTGNLSIHSPFGHKASLYLFSRTFGIIFRIFRKFIAGFGAAGVIYVDDSFFVVPKSFDAKVRRFCNYINAVCFQGAFIKNDQASRVECRKYR
jgi:hypothetical protein